MPHRVNLLRGEPSRIDEVMAGPWRDIRVETIGDEPVRFASDEVEYAGFVIDGTCAITTEDDGGSPLRIPLARGGAFAVPHGGDIRVASTGGPDAPCRLLVIEMALAGAGDR